jgi:peptide chain release factor 2
LRQLEAQAAQPGFWEDQDRAQRVMEELAGLRAELEPWEKLENDVQEAVALAELGEGADEEFLLSLEQELNALERRLLELESELLFSGEHDSADAIVSIHAGAGGTDAQDWVEMLLRMYLRWAEEKGFRTEILDLSPGEEAGIKSVTFEVRGRNAYGLLKAEKGVHRLVRLSPFDAAHRRHTSFALVEVVPDIEKRVEVKIDPDDLRIDVFRSAGAGGQNVQKNATAVRITHIPTGIVVSCQNERSQLQNKETAMRILRAKLYELEKRRQEEELARLKGEHVEAAWGNQIRSYVLHPYQMVKDHRTGVEVGNAQAVLDGDIDRFIEAYLKLTIEAA